MNVTVFPEFTTGPPSQMLNSAANLQTGIDLSHEGLALAKIGDHVGAARVHRQALEYKLAAVGTSDISTAVSYNSLGEALTHLGNLGEAEKNIQSALDIAINLGSRTDEAFYRENLAIVYESSGDLTKARRTRHMSAPDKYVCSYYGVRLRIPSIALTKFSQVTLTAVSCLPAPSW